MGKKKSIPVHNTGIPGNGPPPKITLPDDEPVFSAYTGEQISIGSILYGTPNDAPYGERNHGKPWRCIQFIPAETPFFAAHRMRKYT